MKGEPTCPQGHVVDLLTVKLAGEILGIIPGRVSIEIDARLSYDTDATVARVQGILALLERRGIDKVGPWLIDQKSRSMCLALVEGTSRLVCPSFCQVDTGHAAPRYRSPYHSHSASTRRQSRPAAPPSRIGPRRSAQGRVYIKIAATWEGIRACEVLQKEGVDCNMTLIFSFAQAVACAQAGAALVSPFVGRILDWYKKRDGDVFTPADDPGVLAVRRVYEYFKAKGHGTSIMAASFRNTGEILQLAGIDKITISPALLAELEGNTEVEVRKACSAEPRMF